MKGIIYGRVSLSKQDHARQVSELKDYAKRNDIELVSIFTEVQSGKSATHSRKAAQEMFTFLATHHVDVILVSDLSRLGRSAFDVQQTINKLVYEGEMNLYIYQQGLHARDRQGNINPVFKIVTDVLANVAQMERERISANVKSGLAHAKRQGKTLGRPKGKIETATQLLAKYPKVVKESKNNLPLRKIAKLCDVSVNTVRKVQQAMKE